MWVRCTNIPRRSNHVCWEDGVIETLHDASRGDNREVLNAIKQPKNLAVRCKNGQIWTNSPIKIVISLNCHISSHICHTTWDFFGLQCNSHSITINLFFVSKWIQMCCVNMLNVLWRWATNQSSTTTSAHTSSWFFKKVSWGIPEIIS